jgi:hypothetical protein
MFGGTMPRTRRRITLLLLAVLLAPVLTTLVGAPAKAEAPFFHIKNNSGIQRCLDVRTQDHRTVQMWRCSDKPQKVWEQRFVFDPVNGSYWYFANQLDGRCLEAPTLSGGPGEFVTVETCRQSTSQRWRVFYAFNPAPPFNGWFQVWQNLSTFTCLYLPDNNPSDGTRIETRTCSQSDPAQRWSFHSI